MDMFSKVEILLLPTDSPDGRTDIVTLVRRALVEVCTVPVVLVTKCTHGAEANDFGLSVA